MDKASRTVAQIFYPASALKDKENPPHLPSEEVCEMLLEDRAFTRFGDPGNARILRDLASKQHVRTRLLAARNVAKVLGDTQRADDALDVMMLPQGTGNSTRAKLLLRAAIASGSAEKAKMCSELVMSTTPRRDLAEGSLAKMLLTARALGGDETVATSYEDVWKEELPPTLTEGLKNIERHFDKVSVDEKLLRWCFAQRGDRDMDLETFRARALAGCAKAKFMRGYNLGTNTISGNRRWNPRDLSADIDPAPFQALLDAGRPVVISFAHVGAMTLLSNRLRDMDVPMVQIGANSIRKQDEVEGRFLSTRGNFQAKFLKLIKRLKKEPRVVTIASDGPYGSDRVPVDLLGQQIDLAQGAAVLAYRTGAATFYAGTRWVGDKVEIYFEPGPVAELKMDKQVWNKSWYDFFLGCMKDVIQGPPEDMRLYSGIWLLLAKSLRSGEKKAGEAK